MEKEFVNKTAFHKCVHCKKEAKKFRDFLSLKEYSISKLCQECQDNIWKED
jgi:hypothetical protein